MKSLFTVIFALVSVTAQAQTIRADRFVFNSGTCILRSGSGSPEGVIFGKICDTYWRVDTGIIYSKTSGTNTATGWTTAGVTGSGTVGTIAKWVGTSQLGDSVITEVAGNLTFTPTGDMITAPAGKDILPSLPYDTNIGALSKKYLALHAAELWVETLVAQNTLATIGGRVLVAQTDLLVGDLAPGATTMTVKYNNLVNNDTVYLEANGKVEFMRIASAASGPAGAYVYTIVRNLDGTGADQWYAGDAILNTGNTTTGFIDIYSIQGIKSGSEAGPTMVGNVRNSLTYNDWTPRWAIGNLNGLYGYSSSIYGAAFGVPTAAWLKIDPTNGVRLGYNTTTVTQIDAAGNASFSGTVTASAGTIGGWTILPNYLYSGSTSASRVTISSDGTDAFWAGNFNSVSAPFRVTTAGALTATNATITGAITATSGSFTGTGSGITAINGANITTGTVTATQIAASTITATQIAAGTITAAKMNVSDLSAISANIGTITAGTISGVTITAGSGSEVTLNSSGISIVYGTGTNNQYKFSSGPAMGVYNNGASMSLDVGAALLLSPTGGTGAWVFNGTEMYKNTGNGSLGISGSALTAMYINPTTTTVAYDPVVIDSATWKVYRKTDGYNGTCSNPTSIVIELGIVTGCT